MSTACVVCLGTWGDCDDDAAAASSAVGSHAISRPAPSSFASAAAADGSKASLRATVVISSDDDDSEDDADSNDDGDDGWDDGDDDDDDDEDNDYGQDDFSGGSCHYDEFDEDKEIESSDFNRHSNGHLDAAVDDYAFGRHSTGSGTDHNVSLDALLLQYSIQQQHHVSITDPKRERSLHSQQHQYQQMPLLPHAAPRLGGCIIV
jgi:hypothetical protein